MNPFEHFVLTRCNAPLKAADTAAEHNNDWLTRRFDLFERVSLPSMQRQLEGAYQWLVFMDWATPVHFKERMAALSVRHEFLRPVYCSHFDEATALAEIRRRETAGRTRVTTQLPCAAALHPRMVEQVHEAVRQHIASHDLQRGFAISFPLGCCERKGDFYLRRERANPFISFVSAPETERTALAGLTDVPVVTRTRRPLWCEVLQDDTDATKPCGIYWPMGGSSEFAPGITNGFRRGALWQGAEVVRSACRYWFGR